jgi:tetratricopeptide (TPR) repeat protein
MNLEALKEKARRHEQKEEWPKALDLYRQVIQKQNQDEPPDITLFNRVGDIQTRLKHTDAAVESYEKAVDLYMEAELPNNAIAICKKVLRNLPNRSVFFLRMGQIRGAQGFLTDAKQNFLTYAEMMSSAGEMDAALDALVEFVCLAPDDIEIRTGLASQLESHGRTAEAIEHYGEAYRHLVLLERDEEAEEIAGKLMELAPDQEVPDPDSIRAEAAEQAANAEGIAGDAMGGFELGSHVHGAQLGMATEGMGLPEVPEPPQEEREPEGEVPAQTEAPGGAETDEMELDAAYGAEEEDEDEEVAPLPFLTFDDAEDEELPPPAGSEAEGEEEVQFLPSFASGEEEGEEAFESSDPAGGEEVEALPTLGFQGEMGPTLEEVLGAALEDSAFEAGLDLEDEEPLKPETPVPEEPSTPSHVRAAEEGDLDQAITLVREELWSNPDDVDLCQRQVEYAFRKGDEGVLVSAYLDLANCLIRTGAGPKARAVFQQVLALSPGQEDALAGLRSLEGGPPADLPAQVASSEEYVDLGSLILGEEAEKTTRWQVRADSPSGDDQADFAKMLSQFKDKVSEHVDADDVSARHDLGTAYLEMGLLDEAIGEFQMALRASPNHLPTHEVLGRCWMEMGKPEMAIRALDRALTVDFEVEDELIGIYYLMGQANEGLGNTVEAAEFSAKVFSLDINFKDVTERLRALR